MKKPITTILFTALAALAAGQLQAQVLYSDNFSSYRTGDLDSNESGGPNQAPNGGPGDPWWGPNPGNLVVATSITRSHPITAMLILLMGIRQISTRSSSTISAFG